MPRRPLCPSPSPRVRYRATDRKPIDARTNSGAGTMKRVPAAEWSRRLLLASDVKEWFEEQQRYGVLDESIAWPVTRAIFTHVSSG